MRDKLIHQSSNETKEALKVTSDIDLIVDQGYLEWLHIKIQQEFEISDIKLFTNIKKRDLITFKVFGFDIDVREMDANLEEDAQNRDFTCNSIYYNIRSQNLIKSSFNMKFVKLLTEERTISLPGVFFLQSPSLEDPQNSLLPEEVEKRRAAVYEKTFEDKNRYLRLIRFKHSLSLKVEDSLDKYTSQTCRNAFTNLTAEDKRRLSSEIKKIAVHPMGKEIFRELSHLRIFSFVNADQSIKDAAVKFMLEFKKSLESAAFRFDDFCGLMDYDRGKEFNFLVGLSMCYYIYRKLNTRDAFYDLGECFCENKKALAGRMHKLNPLNKKDLTKANETTHQEDLSKLSNLYAQLLRDRSFDKPQYLYFHLHEVKEEKTRERLAKEILKGLKKKGMVDMEEYND